METSHQGPSKGFAKREPARRHQTNVEIYGNQRLRSSQTLQREKLVVLDVDDVSSSKITCGSSTVAGAGKVTERWMREEEEGRGVEKVREIDRNMRVEMGMPQ